MARFCHALGLAVGILGVFGASATASADGYGGPGIVVAPRSTWSGFYAGVNGGYGFAANSETVSILETFATTPFFGPANHGSLDIAGGFGGGQIGVNHQMGAWVVGLEADIQAADITDSSSGSVTPYLVAGGVATATTKNTVSAFGTVRPRIGFTWDRTLLYATGGLAWGEVQHSMNWADNFGFSASERKSTNQFGYVVGGGIEHAFSPRLSLKLEYQYIDLGSDHHKAPELFGPGGAATAFAVATDTQTDFHTVRIGLNYKFDDRREAPLK